MIKTITKRLFLLFLFIPFLFGARISFAAESCNITGTGCTTACSHVYDTCGLSINDSSGSAMTGAECLSACASTDSTVIDCLSDVECDGESVLSCIETGSASGDSDTEYIGGGGVTDDEGEEVSGACVQITDCNSCISNCRCRYEGTAAVSTCCTGCGCECELYCMPTDWWIATCM